MSRRGPLASLGAALRARGGPLLPQGDTFLRGLALGALVGAAIAGSTLWSRLRDRRSQAIELEGGRETTT